PGAAGSIAGEGDRACHTTITASVMAMTIKTGPTKRLTRIQSGGGVPCAASPGGNSGVPGMA
ncbi:MAG: hypothetical protein EBV45_12205, partial [Chloroflexi bacterium]|nr:hypothetical protein [Chloroflexota bacterium]